MKFNFRRKGEINPLPEGAKVDKNVDRKETACFNRFLYMTSTLLPAPSHTPAPAHALYVMRWLQSVAFPNTTSPQYFCYA